MELMRKAMDAIRLQAQARVKLAGLKAAGSPDVHAVKNWAVQQEAEKNRLIQEYQAHVSTHGRTRTAGS